MKKELVSNSEPWIADLGNGYYQNPVLHADYSDPDVIRVGEGYFMVSSSFNMSPCLPVLHSKDLVNWTIINHVAERFPYSQYDLPRHGEGVWAPSIRYHDGKFWVFFGAPDEGIFMSNTEDPFGKWSELHLVKKVKGWIDPCPFWDEDGQAYLVNAFAKSRIGFKSILNISKMSPDGKMLLDEGTYVFDGSMDHPTIEGPKMYKRNGYYYIFAPAGGVPTGWQTILRSKDIFGPYEDKIVLAQGNTTINGPHQGGWVDDINGDSWFLHFQDKGPYGRIVHLQPMTWEDDWPLMGNKSESGIGEPVTTYKKPMSNNHTFSVPKTSDYFEGKELNKQWQWRANVNSDWYSISNEGLRLNAINQSVTSLYDTPNILTQKFPAPSFSYRTKLTFHAESDVDQFTMLVLGRTYQGITITKVNNKLVVKVIEGNATLSNVKERKSDIIYELPSDCLFIRVDVDEEANCTFFIKEENDAYLPIGAVFKATEGQWIGAQIGMACTTKKEDSSGYAQIEYVEVTKLENEGENGEYI